MNIALIIIFGAALMALMLGLRAAKGRDMNLQQWSLGGRSFGSVFMFVLLAGEIYTTFSFLGASGWSYGKGAASYYTLAYQSLAYVLSYFLLPVIWRYARQHKLISQPHFFAAKYQSRPLTLLVALLGVVSLIPYLMLQFKGLGIIVSIASYGSISATAAIWIGAVIATIYVIVSGMHGVAWNAVVKDALILSVVVFLGIYLPLHYYGGIGAMFDAINTAKPGFLTFPEKGYSTVWFQSTVILTTLGFFMWPHTFSSVMSANSDQTFKRNAALLPVYSLLILFALLIGFAAILQVPGLKGSEVDLALLKLSVQTFSPWFVGVIGAAGLLTAIVPGSMILTSACTIIANDIYRGGFKQQASDQQTKQAAIYMVPVIALITVGFTLNGGSTIAAILLMGYSLVTQLFPALAFSLMRRNPVTSQGAFCGILAGVMTVAAISLTNSTIAALFPFLPTVLQDLNVGVVALVINTLTMGVVSLMTQPTAAKVLAKG